LCLGYILRIVNIKEGIPLSKRNLILESLSELREAEGDTTGATTEDVTGKILFCIDTSSSTPRSAFTSYMEYLKGIQTTYPKAKITLARFSSDGIIVKRNISAEYLGSQTLKSQGDTDNFSSVVNDEEINFKRFEKIYICTDGAFNPELNDKDIQILKKFKTRIIWVVSKNHVTEVPKLKPLSSSKVEIV
jgi:hypothetical protein